jgi:glycosyltransferase involved in cell wall biosynthesis
MTKKKLLFFGIKHLPAKGGTERAVEHMIGQLKDYYNISVYCMGDRSRNNSLEKINIIQIPKIPLGSVGVFLYYLLCSLNVIFSNKYDIIHVQKTDVAIFIPILSIKGKVVATSQEAPYKRDKWSIIGRIYFKLMEWIFMKSPSTLTSVSKPLADYYINKFKRKVHFIPNAIDVKVNINCNYAERIISRYSITDEYVIFAARRIMSTKGCHTMLSALQKIVYGKPIIIAGEDDHVPAYRSKLVRLSKGLDVKFIGYVDSQEKILSLVKRSKYFIFPSETEGLSLMLLEAASTGTPIVCSDIPENTQVFDDNEVLYFRNKDADDLAEKLEWAFSNEELMIEKGRAAKQKVLEKFTAHAIAKEYMTLYESL